MASVAAFSPLRGTNSIRYDTHRRKVSKSNAYISTACKLHIDSTEEQYSKELGCQYMPSKDAVHTPDISNMAVDLYLFQELYCSVFYRW